MNRFLPLLVVFFLSPLLAPAEEGEKPAAESPETLEAAFHYQEGTVSLDNGLAEIKIPAGFRYLGPKDTETVLVRIWGNPSGDHTLGMIVPSNASPADDEGWGVIITYEEEGYVKDKDADSIDYQDLLKDMQEGTKESSEERVKQGYESIELVGWAESPSYDKASHKLYWAKELKFGDSEENTLNYNIRVLGRRGVLVLNAVAGINDLPLIREKMPAVIASIDFKEGHRYADFNPASDKVATYGLAALVAGGVAAKTGLLKGLIAIVLAAKKFIIVGVIALGVLIKNILMGKKRETPPVG
jgi:uncharacterized membrane-anchored protein